MKDIRGLGHGGTEERGGSTHSNYYANAKLKSTFEKAGSNGMRNRPKCRKKMRHYKN